MQLKDNKPIKQVKKGMSDTAPYTAWVNMKASCNSKKHKGYADAGALGIGYVAAWATFAGFWKAMRSTYTVGARLCRKDKKLSYMKGNCVWVPKGGKKPPVHFDNDSGIMGLKYMTDHNGYDFWQYRYTENGTRKNKLFSVNVHGEQKAYYLASLFIRARQGYN